MEFLHLLYVCVIAWGLQHWEAEFHSTVSWQWKGRRWGCPKFLLWWKFERQNWEYQKMFFFFFRIQRDCIERQVGENFLKQKKLETITKSCKATTSTLNSDHGAWSVDPLFWLLEFKQTKCCQKKWEFKVEMNTLKAMGNEETYINYWISLQKSQTFAKFEFEKVKVLHRLLNSKQH